MTRIGIDLRTIFQDNSNNVIERLGKYPGAIENTLKIAENVEFVTDQVHLPKFECPDNMNAEEFLNKLVWEGIHEFSTLQTPKRSCKLELDITQNAIPHLLPYYLGLLIFAHASKSQLDQGEALQQDPSSLMP